MYDRLRILVQKVPGGFYQGVFEECLETVGARYAGRGIQHNCGKLPLYLLDSPKAVEITALLDLLGRFPEAVLHFVREVPDDNPIPYSADDLANEIKTGKPTSK